MLSERAALLVALTIATYLNRMNRTTESVIAVTGEQITAQNHCGDVVRRLFNFAQIISQVNVYNEINISIVGTLVHNLSHAAFFLF